MSMQWEISRSELKLSHNIGKLYNAEKFAELHSQLRGVVDRFQSHERVKTFTRAVAEEVTNIINKNSHWASEPLKVRTTFNRPQNQIGRLKIDIIYAGTEYWDPLQKQTNTVIGSRDKFRSYRREHKFEDSRTHITIHIEIDMTEAS